MPTFSSSPSALPTSLSALLLPSPSFRPTFSQTLNLFKKYRLSIRHRLNSILSAADFVSGIEAAQGLSLVANERCVSWYVQPSAKVGSVYFKSTDGHVGQWALSLRRLNLGILGIIEDGGGYVYLLLLLL